MENHARLADRLITFSVIGAIAFGVFGYQTLIKTIVVVEKHSSNIDVSLKQPLYGDYFLYSSVTAKNYYNIGEKISLTSDGERFRTTTMIYNDALFCSLSGPSKRLFSATEGRLVNLEAGKFSSYWEYQGEIPTIPMSCVMKSSTSAKTYLGESTAQTVISNEFIIR